MNYSGCYTYCFGIIFFTKKTSVKFYDSNTKEGFLLILKYYFLIIDMFGKITMSAMSGMVVSRTQLSHNGQSSRFSYTSLLIKIHYLCFQGLLIFLIFHLVLNKSLICLVYIRSVLFLFV